MKLYAEIKVEAINSGTFKDEDDKSIDYFQVQTLAPVTKKLGDNYVELQDIATLGISKELVGQIEQGKTYVFEVSAKAQTPRSGGFAQVKYRIVGIKQGGQKQQQAA